MHLTVSKFTKFILMKCITLNIAISKLTKNVIKFGKYGQNLIHVFNWSMNATELIFTKLTLSQNQL
jgi:hypothetical protein